MSITVCKGGQETTVCRLECARKANNKLQCAGCSVKDSKKLKCIDYNVNGGQEVTTCGLQCVSIVCKGGLSTGFPTPSSEKLSLFRVKIHNWLTQLKFKSVSLIKTSKSNN